MNDQRIAANIESRETIVQSLIYSLYDIEDRMLKNRAKLTEVLLYQTYLLYVAFRGGDEVTVSDELRASVKELLSPIWESIIAPSNEGVDRLFLSPEHNPDTYAAVLPVLMDSAFHRLPYNEITIHGDTRPFYRFKDKENAFWEKLLLKNNKCRVLQCCPGYLPDSKIGFESFSEYDFVTNDAFSYAFLSLRKQLEGNLWKNVEILREIPTKGKEYDIIHIDVDVYGTIVYSNTQIEEANNSLPLSPEGCLVVHFRQDTLRTIGLSRRLYNTESLRFSITPRFSRERIFVLTKAPNSKIVRFVDGKFYYRTNIGREQDFWSDETIACLIQCDNRFVVDVPYDSIVPGNLNPTFYLLLHYLYQPGYVPLKQFAVLNEIRPAEPEEICSGFVSDYPGDPRLLPLSVVQDKKHERSWGYVVERTSVLVAASSPSHWSCEYIDIEKEKTVRILPRLTTLYVDPNKADIRFIVLCLRGITFTAGADGDIFSSDSDVLELPVPNLTIEEQRKYVDDYLLTLKNRFIQGIGTGDNNLHLLVVTPNKAAFESENKLTLDKLGFCVLEYIEDLKALKPALQEHYGDKVLSSDLADAVLVCADIPTGDIERAMFALGKSGIRSFFFSEKESYDLNQVDDFYLEEFTEGFIAGKDYLSELRARLDSDSDKVRDRYPKFFKAADRLDEEYDWGLAEFATSTLQSNPFKLDINKLRSKIDETVIAFFKSHHVAPSEMDNTAVASLVADKKYYEGRKKVNIALTEELSKTTLDSEAWYKYALVAIRKLGNKDSHSSVVSDSSLELAAFTLFTEIVVWLDSVRERYKDKKCLFAIKKGNVELPFYTVDSYDIDGREYLVANGIHLIDSKHELRAGDQVVVLDTEEEKYPKTINGFRVEKVANPSNYIVAIKA